MTDHPFQGWLEKAANYSSVLACGVYIGSMSMAVKSYSETFTEQQIKDVLQRLAEIALGLRVYQISNSRLRWAFEHGQFHIARRQDGAIGVLAINQTPDAPKAIEELFTDFDAVVFAPPDKPGFRLPEIEGSSVRPSAG
jgi:hypothetical protein